MAEEFIDDIIAAAEPESAGTNNDAGANSTETIADKTTDLESTSSDAKGADESKSSSTSDESTHTNDDDTLGSGDDSTAPGDSSDVEELAAQLGWNKDHKGAESVDAKTYILRSKAIQKTMKDHNKDLKNQLNGLQGSVEALKEHNDRVYKADVKRLQNELTKLKTEKKAAVELADVAKVEELDKQIDDVKKDIEAPVKKDTPSGNPAYDEWIADNKWYLTDPDMAKYADTVAEQYVGAPPERVYAIVRNKVAEIFPDKFEFKKEPEVDKVVNSKTDDKVVDKVTGPKSPVEAGSRTGDTANFTKADLSSDQVAIMNQFVRSGIMTEDQYVADIAKLQGA